MTKEFRTLGQPVAIENGSSKITGYAIRYGVESSVLGDFVEVIAPGAVKSSLTSDNDIRALIDHETSKIIGRQSAGTLSLREDEKGLHFECELPQTTYGNDLKVSVERGDISGASFGFFCKDAKWSMREDGMPVRTITDMQLFEISITPFPAYEQTSVSVRSMFGQDEVPEEIRAKIAEVKANKPLLEKRYHGITSAVANTKWAILPEKLSAICSFLNLKANGGDVSQDEIRAVMQGVHSPEATMSKSVAVIPVYGTISQRMNMMTEFSGGTSTEQISQAFRAALADDSVSAVVFDIDSPGGTVTGVPELAAEIFAARGKKPTVAVSNGMAASAAYWIASACERFVVTPSGEVGSIGVYCAHEDVSAAMDKAGVTITLVSAAKYKTEGNPYEPLGDDAKAAMQADVDAYYEMFVASVAQGRGVSVETVKNGFGQGRMLMAQAALAEGMVDAVETLDDVLVGYTTATAVVAVEDAPAVVAAVNDETVVADSANLVYEDIRADLEDDLWLCECDCSSCFDDEDCENCMYEDCDDENCIDCGMQASAKSRMMVAKMKLRLAQAKG